MKLPLFANRNYDVDYTLELCLIRFAKSGNFISGLKKILKELSLLTSLFLIGVVQEN